jgi:hypothetical protein
MPRQIQLGVFGVAGLGQITAQTSIWHKCLGALAGLRIVFAEDTRREQKTQSEINDSLKLFPFFPCAHVHGSSATSKWWVSPKKREYMARKTRPLIVALHALITHHEDLKRDQCAFGETEAASVSLLP